ncbi:hypothetical protein VKT23_016466 [Stygiomarasmius scandens]|uniref:Uncharacterized protein n=1 Tax=Marasmiellus scandens TaxID=2682957 RepID=A0ABR1IV65_9AGAR
MHPRPILKREPTRYDSRYNSDLPFEDYAINAVHFPPPTSLTKSYDAYSSSTYDRSPIVVSPNSCALPERGCPGRTYNVDEGSHASSSKRSSLPRGGHVHPRAIHSQLPPHYSYSGQSASREPPPLVPDLSSESEESDGFISPPPEPSYYSPVRSSRSPHPSENKYPSPSLYTSIPTYPSPPSYPLPSGSIDSKGRPRRDRERTVRSSSRSRRPRLEDHNDGDYDTATTPTSTTPRRSRKSGSLCAAMSSFSIQDDSGCLGGF